MQLQEVLSAVDIINNKITLHKTDYYKIRMIQLFPSRMFTCTVLQQYMHEIYKHFFLQIWQNQEHTNLISLELFRRTLMQSGTQ